MAKTVVGLFETQEAAEEAVNTLVARGFTNDQIGVALRGETRAASASSNDPLLAETNNASETDEGAVSGLGVGAVIGGTLGLLAAGVSTVVFPGVGAIIAAGAAGQIATTAGGTLAGAGLGAALGSLTGGMAGEATSDERVDLFADILKYGGVIITVDTEEVREREATAIFAQSGAIDLAQRRMTESNPNDAAVREADALDKPAVAEVADTLNNAPDGVTSSVLTPSSNTGLASAQAVANTEASGLASLKPGTESNAPQGIAAPTTMTSVDTTTVRPLSAQAEQGLPYDKPEPYLTTDFAATDDVQLGPRNAFGEQGAHDETVGSIPAEMRGRRARVYGGPTTSGDDPFEDPPLERDLTLSDQYGGVMETSEGPLTTELLAEEQPDRH